MSIISQTTWDKFTQEEKEKIREEFKVRENLITNGTFPETQLIAKGMVDFYQNLFPVEALQPQPLTYEDVARELFKGKVVAFIDSDGDIDGFRCTLPGSASKPNVCSSLKQAEKLLAINKLLNVAKFLNGKDWKPDWSDEKQQKFSFIINQKGEIEADEYYLNSTFVYFPCPDYVCKAIQILGEDTVRLALGDY